MVAKVRVYELAKEFGVESRAVMDRLEEMGESVGSASSWVEAPVVRRLRERFPAPMVVKVSVYELAGEFGVENRAVMDQLEEMGESVGSTSSWLEAPVVRRLRERFAAQAAGQDQRSARSGPADDVTTGWARMAVNEVGPDDVIKYFNDGDIIEGTVVKVDRDEVLLDIGYKTVTGSWRRGVPAKLGPDDGCGWSRAGVAGDRCAARAPAGAVTGSRVADAGRVVQPGVWRGLRVDWWRAGPGGWMIVACCP